MDEQQLPKEASQAAHRANLGLNDPTLQSILENIASGSTEKFSQLSAEAKTYLVHLIEATNQDVRITQDSVDALYMTDYERPPPDPKTFLESTDYCGHMGDHLWDAWKEHFINVCNPTSGIHELILTGALGVGKTLCAMLVIAYKICRLLHLRDPAAFYKLAPGSKIVFGLYAITKSLSKRVGFHDLRDMIIDPSPFFRFIQRRRQTGKESIHWDNKNIEVLCGSNFGHILGMNLFSCVMDEVNYYAQGEKTTDKAHALVSELSRRLESRFMGYGGEIPGIACYISQTRTTTDYLENRIRDSTNKPGVYVCRGSLWDYSPKGYGLLAEQARGDATTLRPFSVDTPCGKIPAFRVYVGSEVSDAEILDLVKKRVNGTYEVIPGEHVPGGGGDIIHIPVNHYKAFEDDLYGALRAQADIPTGSFTPFFSQRRIVAAMFDEDLIHPFREQEIPCYEGQALDLRELFDHESVVEVYMGKQRPIRNPGSPRYIHFDLSLTGDRTGVTMLHPAKHYQEDHSDAKTDKAQVGQGAVLKDIEIDFYIALTAGPAREPIDFRKTRRFVDWLRRIGFHIQWITGDSFQSADHLMRLREAGFQTEVLSVDRTSKPYKNLRTLANEHRVRIPFPRSVRVAQYADRAQALSKVLLFQELIGLEHDVKRDKIDHRERNPDGRVGSKDIADTLAGGAFRCSTDVATPNIDPNKSSRTNALTAKLDRYLSVAPF